MSELRLQRGFLKAKRAGEGEREKGGGGGWGMIGDTRIARMREYTLDVSMMI